MLEKRTITAEDLYRFKLITDCRVSPDGDEVVFPVQRVDRDEEKKFTNLWIVSVGSAEVRQFTYGDQVDTHPRWSPDGRTIAFLSNRVDKEQSQIYLIPSDGGEARRLTDLRGSFETFEWSPDGGQLVLQFRKKDPQTLEREEDEKTKELGVLDRRVTRPFYKLDGAGYLPEQERWHIWLVDVESGEVEQITKGDVHDEESPIWSPDGEFIAFVSNRAPQPDLEPDLVDLFVITASGGEMRKIDTPVGPKMLPRFSSDGEWITYVGREGRREWWKNMGVWVVPADGSGPARDLTAEHDVHVDTFTINDMGSAPLVRPTWSKESDRLYFQVVEHGSTVLKSVSLAGDDLQDEIDGPGVVGAYTFDDERSRLAYFFGEMQDPGQVWVREMESGESRQLTHLNGDLLGELDLGEVEEVWFEGGAGNELQGWILKPPDFDPEEKYPSILEIHGGPGVQYGHFFMHEFYFLAANGYVVYFSNPRGGRGYGEAHYRAIWGGWGDADYQDLMAWTDYVAALPYIDTKRMGVTGGSYGGYMTGWIVGHTDRFQVAVSQRMVSNLISMWGSSDFNWSFQVHLGDVPPWEDLEKFWDHSPMKYVGNVTTPTMVIHSENDLRCPIEQGEQFFVALQKLGVDSEMIRFPDEPHGLSRTGRTDRRIARLEHIVRWFDRYLKDERQN